MATERAFGRRTLGRRQGARWLPERTARRVGATSDWTSKRLAVECRQLAAQLQEVAGLSAAPLIDLLAAVSVRASPSGSRSDVPPSTWPSGARELLSGILQAQAALALSAGGAAFAPLSHVWELYEAWIGSICLSTLIELLGEPETLTVEANEWVAGWADSSSRLVACSQHAFGASSRTLLGGDRTLMSVTAELIPDLLVARSEGDRARLTVIMRSEPAVPGLTLRLTVVFG